MPDKIPFKCMRCSTTWERTIAELNRPDTTVYRGKDPKQYVYRSTCPTCGTTAVTEINVSGDSHA
jgi:hypothetical protein